MFLAPIIRTSSAYDLHGGWTVQVPAAGRTMHHGKRLNLVSFDGTGRSRGLGWAEHADRMETSTHKFGGEITVISKARNRRIILK